MLNPFTGRLAAAIAGALAGLVFASTASALSMDAQAPAVDTAGLAELTEPWPEENPYRGNPVAAAVGRAAFNQACAVCHGQDADGARSPAPDLRRLGRACKQVQDPGLRRRCMQDVDVHFRDSVRRGKVKVGVRHMPAWDRVLKPELVWAIRSFIESTNAQKPDGKP